MNKTPFVFAMVVGLLPTLPSPAMAQKAGSRNKPVAGTAAEYAQLAKLPEVVGRLAYVDSSTRKLALNIDYQYPVANKNRNNRSYPRGYSRVNYGAVRGSASAAANLQREWLSLVRRQEQAMTIRNPAQRMQRLTQIAGEMERLQVQMMMTQARAVANMEQAQMRVMMNQARTAAARQRALQSSFKLAAGTKQFDLHATENIVVRRLNPPFEYDDKGYPKKYSKDELQALRGKDTSLPGYTARREDLQPGQMVKMYLVRAKTGKKEDAPVVAVAEDDLKGPPVRMILILADSDGRDTPVLVNANGNKRKKKN
jgi:hypothetical protein